MSFAEVREYQMGDDIRSIDWNVTARFNHPYVKVFEEERELTFMLLIDVSGSSDFGTVNQSKRAMITEIAATLAFSSLQNNDKIGVIFFSDKIEKFIAPQKGKKHVLYIIRELIDFKPESNQTDVSVALRYFANVIKKRCTAFMISDFMSPDFEKALMIAAKKHDLVAMQVYDMRDADLPDVGWVKMKDAETGQTMYVDTASVETRLRYNNYWRDSQHRLQQQMAKNRVDMVSIRTDEDYVKALITLFRMRG
jgi:uncharacterized protein (DUF58 family)